MVARTSTNLEKRMARSGQAPTGVRLVPVAEDRDGQRIDNFLGGQLKGVPKSLIYRIVRTGQVRINGKRAKPDTRIAEGDEVRIPPVRTATPADHGVPPRRRSRRSSTRSSTKIAISSSSTNPPALPVTAAVGSVFGAIELLRAARPGDTLELAHRLDRDTSGVLVFARRRPALIGLQALIRDGQTPSNTWRCSAAPATGEI